MMGMRETLEALKQAGIHISVLSNKPHGQAVNVIADLFGEGYFDAVQGQVDGIPRKPAPDGALKLAEKFGVKPEECLYIGDTGTDMLTGTRAGMHTLGVLWGFRDRKSWKKTEPGRFWKSRKKFWNMQAVPERKGTV